MFIDYITTQCTVVLDYLNNDEIARKDFNFGLVDGCSLTVERGAGLAGVFTSFFPPVKTFISICMLFCGGELIVNCFKDFKVTTGCVFFLLSFPVVLHSMVLVAAVLPLVPIVFGVFVFDHVTKQC
jgi:hypothetical protein